MGFHTMTPALLQKKARLFLGQQLHLMSKPDPRVELRRDGLGDDSLPATISESAAQSLVTSMSPLPLDIPLEHIQRCLAEIIDRHCGRNAPPCPAHEERLFRKRLTPCAGLPPPAPDVYW